MDEVEIAFNALTKEVMKILRRGDAVEIAVMDQYVEGHDTLKLVVEACKSWEEK